MKERPILFKGPLVRAILSGQKTVTRRPLKMPHGFWETSATGELVPIPANCPYGKPGDRLWVRETWYCDHFEVMRGPYLKPDDLDIREALEDGTLVYGADGLAPYEQEQPTWKPSIHMPRWACRILLEITAVRVERLEDLDEDQAQAEGFGDHEFGCSRPCEPDGYPACSCGSLSYVDSFRRLWESINGPQAWAANPWVWVVEFKRVMPP